MPEASLSFSSQFKSDNNPSACFIYQIQCHDFSIPIAISYEQGIGKSAWNLLHDLWRHSFLMLNL